MPCGSISFILQMVRRVSEFFPKTAKKEPCHYSSLDEMDVNVIDISSSDSENEAEVGPDIHANFLNNGVVQNDNYAIGISRQNHSDFGNGLAFHHASSRVPSSGMPAANSGIRFPFQNNIANETASVSAKAPSLPRVEEHEGEISVGDLIDGWEDDGESPSHISQKRILPHSFMQNASDVILKSTPQSHQMPAHFWHNKIQGQVEPFGGLELDRGDNTGKSLKGNHQEGSSTFIRMYDEGSISKCDADHRQVDTSAKLASPKQQSDKRTLPHSLQASLSRTVPQAPADRNVRQFQNVPLKADGVFGVKTSDMIYAKHDSDDEDDELYIYDVPLSNRPNEKYVVNSYSVDTGNYHRETGTVAGEVSNLDYNTASAHRFLPSWMNGKSDSGRHASSSQPQSSSDGREHSTLMEQEAAEHDERIVYEAVLQDLAQPQTECDVGDDLLTVPLLKHQKIALGWLEQKEIKSLPCSGGILADDQGLGKTISMIALILKQMPQQKKFMLNQSVVTNSEALNLDDDDNSVSQAVKDEAAKEESSEVAAEPNTSSAPSKRIEQQVKGRPAAGTLVVCPLSVLRQWARELDEKVASSGKLSVTIYHGNARTKHPTELAKYDVVLTTYAIISNEVPKQSVGGDDDGERKNSEDYGLTPDFSTDRKRKPTASAGNKKKKKGKGLDLDYGFGPLSRVRWFRVILDEAQVIKNHRTQVARACCGLRAKRRWCLSGTPLQNAIDDLYSYFRFLKYDPYASYSSFCSGIKHPIIRNASNGYKKLQAVLGAVMLRRTKGTLLGGQPILKLPPKTISLEKLRFSFEERSFYADLEANFRDRFKAYAAEGTVKQNYANILLMLLRLRQACNHPLLAKDFQSDSSRKTSMDVAKRLPRETLTHLLSQLEDAFQICGICTDPPEDAVVTICGHVFCYQCISESLTGEDSLCPASSCHRTLDNDSIFSKGTLRCCIPDGHENNIMTTKPEVFEDSAVWRDGFVSSKIGAAMKVLNLLHSKDTSERFNEMCSISDCTVKSTLDRSYSDSNVIVDLCAPQSLQHELPPKAIVFSQWTSMLDLLETSLNHSLIQYRRLDGSLSLASRDQAVRDFNTDPEVTVMIMSLKAGNLGLNMIAACHVILLDPWWNPTSEDQAIDRAHRIGQTRPVTVHRLTVEDTVEERILKLQEKKRDMVSSAFGEDPSGKTATRLTVEDLRYLFMV